MAAAHAPAHAPAPSHAAPVAFEEPKKGKSPILLIAIVGAVLIGGGAAAFLWMRGKGDQPATTASSTIAPATSAATQTIVPATTDTSASALVPTATSGTTQTALDPSLVDQEVARRIAAERARLEAQSRNQQQPQTATTQTTAPARPVPTPVEDVPAPVPAPVETRPAPQPVQPATATEAPAPAPQQPAVRVREGDLVAAGTPGLTPPRLTRRGTVTYPPLARAQRAQGTVITSVLVSETGAVLDVRVIRGVNAPVGLNEAAVQTMRRSAFAPASLDGVRVRSWVTVPIEFKL
jgi:TonB family protein